MRTGSEKLSSKKCKRARCSSSAWRSRRCRVATRQAERCAEVRYRQAADDGGAGAGQTAPAPRALPGGGRLGEPLALSGRGNTGLHHGLPAGRLAQHVQRAGVRWAIPAQGITPTRAEAPRWRSGSAPSAVRRHVAREDAATVRPWYDAGRMEPRLGDPERPVPPSPADRAPPASSSANTLENGDRLTRAEFERRYEARPDIKKAELIEGVVHMPSPTRSASHGRPHAATITWLGSYAASTPGVQVNDNSTVRLDLDNEPQPDAALLIDPGAGGQARLSDDDYIEGAPELIAEVAFSSASYDLHDKLHAYRRNGVREYLVWRTLEHRIDWFELADGAYRPLQPDADGVIHSDAFPGLRLALDAMLRADLATVLRELQRGLGENAHQAFVARLAGRMPSGETAE